MPRVDMKNSNNINPVGFRKLFIYIYKRFEEKKRQKNVKTIVLANFKWPLEVYGGLFI